MGFTRKTMSMFTGGAVDFRSDKERIARKTAKGARYQKKSYKLAKRQDDEERHERRAAATATAPSRQGLFGKSRGGTVVAHGDDGVEPEGFYEDDEYSDDYEDDFDLVESLERLTSLRDSGALSETEFDAAKARLLGQE